MRELGIELGHLLFHQGHEWANNHNKGLNLRSLATNRDVVIVAGADFTSVFVLYKLAYMLGTPQKPRVFPDPVGNSPSVSQPTNVDLSTATW